MIDQLAGNQALQTRQFTALRQAVEQLQQRLEAVDQALFAQLRVAIRDGFRGMALCERLEELAGSPASNGQPQSVVGYDSLDRLVTGVLDADTLPEPVLEPEPEMVLYQRTPARIIFELVRRINSTSSDVFYDLGSGLGHVATLVHLLSGLPTTGIEYEPAFCAYARERAAVLGLTQVAFHAQDARQADYAAGTIFFLYSPFEGTMLRAVLERLHERAQHGPIRLASYGPCTGSIAQQRWLTAPDPAEPGSYRLALFRSL